MRLTPLIGSMIVLTSCGDGLNRSGSKSAYPSNAFADFLKSGGRGEDCDNGTLPSCARVNIAVDSYDKMGPLAGLTVVCSHENDTRVVTISNAFNSLKTFEVFLRFPTDHRGLLKCKSLESESCEVSGFLHERPFHSKNGKGCLVRMNGGLRTEGEFVCEELKVLNGILIIAGGSRFTCPD